MMLKVESARSLLYYAACTVDAWLAGEVDRAALHEAACMASACASDAASSTPVAAFKCTVVWALLKSTIFSCISSEHAPQRVT